MVEGTPLLREHTLKKCIEGSNPSLSAKLKCSQRERFSLAKCECLGASSGSTKRALLAGARLYFNMSVARTRAELASRRAVP